MSSCEGGPASELFHISAMGHGDTAPGRCAVLCCVVQQQSVEGTSSPVHDSFGCFR